MSDSPTDLIRQTGVFFIPKGGFTTELHLAAFLHIPRDTVLADLVFRDDAPEGEEGIRCVKLGNRRVCTTDAAFEVIDRLARPQKRPRRKGGARCRKRKSSGKSK